MASIKPASAEAQVTKRSSIGLVGYLWIPAFAGMTKVSGNDKRERE
jgi:hypothetical protein